jgi:5,5'-dehydrodivanillate O-demethylase
MEWRVPIDDRNTLSVLWLYVRVPEESEPYVQLHQDIPSWYAPVIDPLTKRWIVSHNMNEDITAWVGQGAITDRTREHLGESDKGIIMFRRKLFDQLDVIKAGGEPKGILRDPQQNQAIALPVMDRGRLMGKGQPLASYGGVPPKFFTFAGQPAEVHRQYRRAMGFPEE